MAITAITISSHTQLEQICVSSRSRLPSSLSTQIPCTHPGCSELRRPKERPTQKKLQHPFAHVIIEVDLSHSHEMVTALGDSFTVALENPEPETLSSSHLGSDLLTVEMLCLC